MNSNDDKLRRIQNIRQDKLGSVSNTLTHTDWDDLRFKTRWYEPAQQEFCQRSSLDSLVKVCTSYLAWYLGLCQPASGKEMRSAMYSILSGMKLGEDHIFESGQSESSTLSGENITVREYTFAGTTGSTFQVADETCDLKKVQTFAEKIKELVESTTNLTRQLLVNLTGYIIMTTLRVGPKGVEEVSQHIIRSTTKSFKNIFSDIEFIIPPFSRSYKELIDNYLSDSGKHARYMRALIVQTYVDADSEEIKGALKAAFILGMAENGLGLVSWPLKASRKLRCDLSRYLQHVVVDDLILDQAVRLADFLGQNNGKTWMFCRLLESSALFSMSTRNNLDICAVSAIIELGSVEKVSELAQFKSQIVLLKSWNEVAEAVKEILGERELHY